MKILLIKNMSLRMSQRFERKINKQGKWIKEILEKVGVANVSKQKRLRREIKLVNDM